MNELLYALAAAVLMKEAMFRGMRMPKVPKGVAPAAAGTNPMVRRMKNLKVGAEAEPRAQAHKPQRSRAHPLLHKVWKGIKAKALPAAGLAALYAATGDHKHVGHRIAEGFGNAALGEAESRMTDRLFS